MIGTKRQRHEEPVKQEEKSAPVLIGFRRVYVFDIAQTEGAELPEPAKVTGEVGIYHDPSSTSFNSKASSLNITIASLRRRALAMAERSPCSQVKLRLKSSPHWFMRSVTNSCTKLNVGR